MFAKITALVVIGFVMLTAHAQDSVFSFGGRRTPSRSPPARPTPKPVTKPVKPYKPFKKPIKKIKYKLDNDNDEDDQWTNYTMDVFNQCDYNGSGFINQDEYQSCSGWNDPNWSSLVAQFDLNNDQILSWQELYNAARYFDKHPLTITE